jgi:Icc protein
MTASLLQLSDPHLLADPNGCHRGKPARANFVEALAQAQSLLPASADLLLLTGDLCQDESWLGYVALRELLTPVALPVALLAGNHDHPQLLRACLGRQAVIAPALLAFGKWWLLLLDSHCPGQIAGRVPEPQLRWAEQRLRQCSGPVLLAVHHPPDDMLDGQDWLHRLAAVADLRLILVGHIHQHRRESWASATLLGCPSTLLQFPPRQPCPLAKADWPGGRYLRLEAGGNWSDELLRWPA